MADTTPIHPNRRPPAFFVSHATSQSKSQSTPLDAPFARGPQIRLTQPVSSAPFARERQLPLSQPASTLGGSFAGGVPAAPRPAPNLVLLPPPRTPSVKPAHALAAAAVSSPTVSASLALKLTAGSVAKRATPWMTLAPSRHAGGGASALPPRFMQSRPFSSF